MRITILKCICSFRLYSCALVCIYPCVYIRTVIYAKATNATTSRRNHNIRSISRCPYRYRLTTASSYRHRRNRFHSPPPSCRRKPCLPTPIYSLFNVSLFSPADNGAPASGVFTFERGGRDRFGVQIGADSRGDTRQNARRTLSITF